MKKLLILLSILFHENVLFGINQAIDDEYSSFYNSPEINFISCGNNISLFLKRLNKKGLLSTVSKGYVVSIHDDFAYLNHFQARWGRKEFYSDGSVYSRTNWYFHVFLVLDDYVYDFSGKEKSSLALTEYLESSYIPKSDTKNIFIQGVLTREKVLRQFLNLQMNLYKLSDFINEEIKLDAYYNAPFFELFKYAGIKSVAYPLDHDKLSIPEFKKNAYGNFPKGQSTDYILYQKSEENSSYKTFHKPYVLLNGEDFPIKKSQSMYQLCQSLGYWGAFPKYSKSIKTSNTERMVEILSNLRPQKPLEILFPQDVKSSFQYLVNENGVYELVENVACGDISSALKGINT